MSVHDKRQERIKDYLKEKDIDCALITRPEHVFYLSGYKSDEGYPLAIILPVSKNPVMIVSESE